MREPERMSCTALRAFGVAAHLYQRYYFAPVDKRLKSPPFHGGNHGFESRPEYSSFSRSVQKT